MCMCKSKKVPVTDVLLYMKAGRVGGDLTIQYQTTSQKKLGRVVR